MFPKAGEHAAQGGNTVIGNIKETYMKITYITTPKQQYVTRNKPQGMKYTRTIITCPLCQQPFAKRDFEEHAYKFHGTRADECFAKLFGVPWPAKCTCGKDLRYSQANKGFPMSCGNCAMGTVTGVEYHSVDEAKQNVEKLKAALAFAQDEARRLAREDELNRTPIDQLPFPSRKDPRLLKKISMSMRTFAINGEKDNLIKLANFIDALLKKA